MNLPQKRRWRNPSDVQECRAFLSELLNEFPLVLETNGFEESDACSIPARTVYKATRATYPFKVWLEKTVSKRGLTKGVDYKTVDLDPSVEENAHEISKGRGTLVFFTASAAHDLARINDAYLEALCAYCRLDTELQRFEVKDKLNELQLLREKHADELRLAVQSLNQHLNALTSQEPQGEQA